MMAPTNSHRVRRLDALVAAAPEGRPELADVMPIVWPLLVRQTERRWLVRRCVDADDVAQVVLLRAVAAWPRMSFASGRGLAAWFHAIRERIVVDLWRRDQLVAFVELPKVPTWASSDCVEDEAVARADWANLSERAHGLGCHLLLRFALDGASYDELAVTTGRTRAAVKSRMWRERALLREAISWG